MKKIITILFAVAFFGVSANALEKRIGISAASTAISSDGTETVKSSGTKNKKTQDEDVIVPSIFFEVANDDGIALGIDWIPAEADLGSGTNARTDTDTDDASDTAGTNKAAAELTGHTTIYVSMPVGGSGAYVKLGYAMAEIETKETLATGTVYGNEDVTGTLLGVGFNKDNAGRTFWRAEASYTDYDTATFNGQLDTDSVRNKIDADLEAVALRLSFGKAF